MTKIGRLEGLECVVGKRQGFALIGSGILSQSREVITGVICWCLGDSARTFSKARRWFIGGVNIPKE